MLAQGNISVVLVVVKDAIGGDADFCLARDGRSDRTLMCRGRVSGAQTTAIALALLAFLR